MRCLTDHFSNYQSRLYLPENSILDCFNDVYDYYTKVSKGTPWTGKDDFNRHLRRFMGVGSFNSSCREVHYDFRASDLYNCIPSHSFSGITILDQLDAIHYIMYMVLVLTTPDHRYDFMYPLLVTHSILLKRFNQFIGNTFI